jgi:hypothetical protein
MPITLICPNLKCRSILQVPDKVRGRKVRCSKCGRDFLVPSPQEAAKKKEAPKPEASPTEQ